MSTFAPHKDYLLPIGQFMQKLLGDKFLMSAEAEAVQRRANLVLLQKYYPEDETKQQLMQDVMQADKPMPDINDFIPAEVDIEAVQNEAKESAKEKADIDGVPRLDEVLCTTLDKETLLACQQVQLGLKVIAANEVSKDWENIEAILPVPSSDSDSRGMFMVKDTLNKLLHVKEAIATEKDPYKKMQLGLAVQISRISGFMAIIEAQDILADMDAMQAVMSIQRYADTEGGIERNLTYEQAYNSFINQVQRYMPPDQEPEVDRPQP